MKRMQKVHDLVEEAKRRTILWAIFVWGLAFLLSLTSNSTWLNIPIAILILAVLRYLSFELEIRKRIQELDIPSHLAHLLKHQISLDDPLVCSPPISIRWRRKIDSPIIEAAVDEFTRRIVKEFVTDLWFSSLSPDRDVPEQLCLLINDVFGEIAQRVKRINLINLLTRDLVELVGNHLELFRQTKAAIGAKVFDALSSEEREERIKLALLRKNQLHPALSSPDFECKVLQQLMSGVVAILLRPQDAQCPLMRGLARELLACAVLRPIMKFASPGFINKAIEKATLSAKEKSQNKKPDKVIMDERLSGKSSKGTLSQHAHAGIDTTSAHSSEDVLRGGSSRPWESESQDLSMMSNKMSLTNSGLDSSIFGKQGDWAQMLDAVSQKRTRTLAPENLDNLWTKGRNYRKRELQRAVKSNQAVSVAVHQTSDVPASSYFEKQDMKLTGKDSFTKHRVSNAIQVPHLGDSSRHVAIEPVTRLKEKSRSFELPKAEKRQDFSTTNQLHGQGFLQGDGAGSGIQIHGIHEVKQAGSWNMDLQEERHQLAKTRADTALEPQDQLLDEPLPTALHDRHSRSSNTVLEGWQKLEKSTANQENSLNYWDAPGMNTFTGGDQLIGWLNDPSGKNGQSLSVHSAASKLNCWVVGAHLEKAASKTFAVYSIAVTDADNKTWFVERRFRNFEQLHRNLRDLPQYDLQLPPKRFLSSSLDDTFVRDRCILLDKYLKDLLSIPSIAELHEVWDFLSVTSKSYSFSKSPSVMKTLAVNVDDAVDDMFRQLKGVSDVLRRVGGPPSPLADGASSFATEDTQRMDDLPEASLGNNVPYLEREKLEHLSDDEYGGLPGAEETAYLVEECDVESTVPDLTANVVSQQRTSEHDKNKRQSERRIEHVGSDALSPDESLAGSEMLEEEFAVPPEWSPPKLTVPLLNLVDVIFQLQGRGWIRRQVFWMAKQILQLGMGDAVDDWLVAQIQRLRKEDVVVSSIKRVQEILWPGGIFITKKKNIESDSMQMGSSSKATKQTLQKGMDQSAFFESQLEASRCARVVHEILVEGGPAALVSLVGKKQYTRCAKDIYYFLQSTVFLKQLTYSVLETLLAATFPELSHLILDIRQGLGHFVI